LAVMRALRRGAVFPIGLGVVSFAAGALQPASHPRARPFASAALPLASTVSSPLRPTIVLVHGLDSSRETWHGLIAALAKRGYPAIAFDQRGHGESPLGDPASFSAAALAEDVLAAVAAQGIESCVLVGHSMGGRVAMRAAAIEADRAGSAVRPPLLRALVIEDMDCLARAPPKMEEVEAWADPGGRRFDSWASARAALLPHYGGEEEAGRVDAWRGVRVRAQPDGSWWSDINPLARLLARQHVLSSSDGSRAWGELAGRGHLPFSVHVWCADNPGTPRGSVCAKDGDDGIEGMRQRLPATEYRLFEGSGHSIHNTAADEFLEALCAVVDAAARKGAAGGPAVGG